ncbi:MAG: VirB4-like conjugal transfer ATPase, CD1110 family [Candidatus Levyibacteriota bacterium]
MFGKKKEKQVPQSPAIAAKETPHPVKHFERGMGSLVDIIAPSSAEVDFRSIRIGNKYYRTLFVIGYPRYVSTGWLAPLVDFDHSLEISMFVYPVFVEDVLTNLKRKIAEMEATLSAEDEGGKILNPKTTAALNDALALQEELAKGIERFFQFSLYVTLSADSVKELEETTKKLTSTLSSLLLVAKTATLQMEDGFKATLPLGLDRLSITRNMDTSSLASTFPFTSATLTQDKGILYGVNQQNGSLVVFDRYSLENANEVVFGKSGSGKSFAIKLEIMRQFMFGTEVIVVDPEREYDRLAASLGGEHVDFSPTSSIKINPFDLEGIYEEGENELGLKILSLRALLKIMLGDIDPSLDAILDRALVKTYNEKGITQDPETQTKTPPLLEDLYKVLLATNEPKAQELALLLEKFITGSLSGLFNAQSNFDIKNPLTVFSIRDLEDELRPIAMHIILDYIWTRVRKTMKKRLLIVDEAWYLMKHEDSASFIYGIAKRARKYYLGLTTATQDVQDFLSTDYGKAILTNSSIQILLKQSPAEIDSVAKTFYLSEGEKQLILSSAVGEGLFFAGQNHVAMQIVAAPFEHEVITSNPEELQKIKKDAGDKLEQEKQAANSATMEEKTQISPVASPQPQGEKHVAV